MSPPSNSRLSRHKENIEDMFKGAPTLSSPPVSPLKGHSKGLSTSHIPTLKSIRSAPPSSPTRPTTSPSKSNSGKLRLQSPQKLRERLQTERQAVEEVDANLQSELSKITADMARMNSSLPRSATVDIRKLASTVSTLESRLPAMIQELTERHETLQKDMENTLKATEAKVKAIDQLYKESTAENEILYEKFNGELGKIVRALKGKGGEKEELMVKVKEASEETARVKKENARLKREMASLRTLIKGGAAEAA
jgi:hypothetical protein